MVAEELEHARQAGAQRVDVPGGEEHAREPTRRPEAAGRRAVVGVDATRGGWVAVTLVDGAFAGAAVVRRLGDLADVPAARIGADVPIGPPERGVRAADLAARELVGTARAASVFLTPPARALEAATQAEATAVARSLDAPGVSAQAWALRPRIAEAGAAALADARVFEVHPEVSFAVMAGAPLPHPKRSWNGLCARIALLARCGIALPDDLAGAAAAAADDVVDAAAAAWTADRLARGAALVLPAGGAPAARGTITA